MAPPIVSTPAYQAGRPSGEPEREVKDQPLTLPKEASSLTIRVAELKPLIADSPEKRAETITLSQDANDILLNTLTSHFEKIDKMKKASNPTLSLQDNFYDAFKAFSISKFKGVDLSKPDEVEKCAKAFLVEAMETEGGGKMILAVMKLAQMEAATLLAATGRQYDVKGRSQKYENIAGREVNLVVTADGAVEEIEVIKGHWWSQIKGKKELRHIQFKITGGTEMRLSSANTLLNNAQRNFLKAGDWSDGNLNEEQILAIDKRLSAIARLQIELYTKTGLTDLSQIELNFIKKSTGAGSFLGRAYSDPRVAYFLGEGVTVPPSSTMREVLEAQGVAITTEVKDKVQKEIDEKKKKSDSERIEGRAIAQIEARIEEIRKKYTDLSPEKREEKQREINAEIKRLQEEFRLFGRQRAIVAEIAEAIIVRDEAETRVKSHEGTITVPSGETKVDLIEWSAGTANPESWRAIKVDCEILEKHKIRMTDLISGFKDELKDLLQNKPQEKLDKVTTTETRGGTKTEQIVEPDPLDKEIKQRWFDKVKYLQDEIVGLREQIIKVKSQDGGTKTLEEKITELTEKYMRRKTVADDDATTKQILDEYHAKVKAVQDKEHVRDAVAKRIAALPGGENSEDKIEAKLEVESERLENIGAPSGEDKLEIQALDAMKSFYGLAIRENREERIKEAEFDALNISKYRLEYDPEVWKQYPVAILRCIQLIWGDDVLIPINEEQKKLAENVKGLVKSAKYLEIILGIIETKTGKNISDTAERVSATEPSKNVAAGEYDLAKVFPEANLVVFNTNVPISKINKEIIDDILDKIRIKAIGVTSVS